MKTKVQLINAPISSKYKVASRGNWSQPLNILSIATFLSYKNPEIEVEILDGEILTQKEILKRVKADFVGISTTILNYENSLEIGKLAKEKGAQVIFGGSYTSSVGEVILQNRNFVDALVISEGEIAFNQYINNYPLGKIENLIYRNGGKIIKNSVKLINLDSLPIIERSFVDMGAYFKNFQNKFKTITFPFKRPASIYSQKGCLWKIKTGGCHFCCLERRCWRGRDPKKLWAEIKYLVDKYKVDYILDYVDSTLTNKDWFNKFYNLKPKDINPYFLLYARSDEINNITAEMLSKINTYDVFIGFESGDNKILKLVNKGTTVEQNLKAAKLLKKYGIKIFASFILGLPQETRESAKKTLYHAKEITSIADVHTITSSILIPYPGSKTFSLLLSNSKTREKYLNKDIFDQEQLQKDWVKYYCKTDYDFLKKINEEILKLAPIKSSRSMLFNNS